MKWKKDYPISLDEEDVKAIDDYFENQRA
jgi:hypothetical protein